MPLLPQVDYVPGTSHTFAVSQTPSSLYIRKEKIKGSWQASLQCQSLSDPASSCSRISRMLFWNLARYLELTCLLWFCCLDQTLALFCVLLGLCFIRRLEPALAPNAWLHMDGNGSYVCILQHWDIMAAKYKRRKETIANILSFFLY